MTTLYTVRVLPRGYDNVFQVYRVEKKFGAIRLEWEKSFATEAEANVYIVLNGMRI